MLGTLILVLVIVLLLLGLIWLNSPSQPQKKEQETEEVSEWEEQKQQSHREHEAEKNKEWFSEKRWLTDKEIDWAVERMPKDKRFKTLPAHQFHYVQEITNQREKGTDLAFKELLNQINDSNKELIFIPINNPNFHWSLLIYETTTKKFYHYDTLLGANDKYIKPLVRELVEQIQVRNVKEEYLIKKYEIRQKNGWECGVAIIAIMRRIIELSFKQSLGDRLKYGKFRLGDDLGEIDFGEERGYWRELYLNELK